MRMMGWARPVAAALVLGLTACAGLGIAEDKPWQEFRMFGADFAVSMPAQPEVNEDITEKDGNVRRNYGIEAGAMTYTVAYRTETVHGRKAMPLDHLLGSASKELASRMKGTLHDERRFSFDDTEGLEFVLDVPASDNKAAHTVNGRIYVKHVGAGRHMKDVLYETLVTGTPGRVQGASVTRFLDSFHFIEG
jgi:hypothetical protein